MQYLYKDDDNVFKEITKRFYLWWCMRVLKVESTAENTSVICNLHQWVMKSDSAIKTSVPLTYPNLQYYLERMTNF